MQDKGHKNARYFHDPNFLARLALLTDVSKHLNKLNTELQGKGKWVFDFQSSIKAFVSKIQILREGKTNNYSYFCHFQEFNATIDVDFYKELDLEEAKKDLLDYLENLTGNMTARFKDLIAECLDFAQFPFKADTKHCGATALEIAELRADNEARINFDVFQDIAKFWIQLPHKHSTVKNRALQVLVRFGITYVCEAGFSLILLKMIIAAV